MIYFDYAATTPIDEEVLNAYIKTQKNFYANTTSLHKLGQEANFLLDKASKETLQTLGFNDHDIIYVSNATEANNLGIYGYLKNKKGKVITTSIEHPSVYEIFKDLENNGYEVVYLKIKENGKIDLEQLKKEIDKDTLLVSIMWVNNIIGSIQPIKEIIEILRDYPKCRLHVDAVQGITKVCPDFNFNDIDMFTFSTHKIYGPKGIGCLIINKHLSLEKILHGSSAQRGIKPGTLDLALVVATTKAIKKFYPLTSKHLAYVSNLKKLLIEKISNNNHLVLNSLDDCSPYIINISIPNINGETVVHKLEQHSIYVSTGSSCSSKLKKPEKTILALTNDERLATSSIRISLSHLVTEEDIVSLGECLNSLGEK